MEPQTGREEDGGMPDGGMPEGGWSRPPGPGDPRLEIPEVLRTPIDHPSKRPKPDAGMMGSGLGDLGTALAMGLDFLFTGIAAAVVGYLIDRALGSSPAGLLIGLGIGFVAGTVRLIRRSNAQDRAQKPPPPSKPGTGSPK